MQRFRYLCSGHREEDEEGSPAPRAEQPRRGGGKSRAAGDPGREAASRRIARVVAQHDADAAQCHGDRRRTARTARPACTRFLRKMASRAVQLDFCPDFNFLAGRAVKGDRTFDKFCKAGQFFTVGQFRPRTTGAKKKLRSSGKTVTTMKIETL